MTTYRNMRNPNAAQVETKKTLMHREDGLDATAPFPVNAVE